MANGDDACDLHIPYFNRPTKSMQLCRKLTGTIGRSLVKVQNMMLQLFSKHGFECFLQTAFPLAVRQRIEAETYFENGDTARPNGVGCLGIEPRNHGRIWLNLHQFRNDIGVEYKHYSKLGGVGGRARNSSIGSCKPILAKRLAIFDPRLLGFPKFGKSEDGYFSVNLSNSIRSISCELSGRFTRRGLDSSIQRISPQHIKSASSPRSR